MPKRLAECFELNGSSCVRLNEASRHEGLQARYERTKTNWSHGFCCRVVELFIIMYELIHQIIFCLPEFIIFMIVCASFCSHIMYASFFRSVYKTKHQDSYMYICMSMDLKGGLIIFVRVGVWHGVIRSRQAHRHWVLALVYAGPSARSSSAATSWRKAFTWPRNCWSQSGTNAGRQKSKTN